jgi:hypothetical protein
MALSKRCGAGVAGSGNGARKRRRGIGSSSQFLFFPDGGFLCRGRPSQEFFSKKNQIQNPKSK